MDYSGCDSHLDWLRWTSCLHLLKTLVTSGLVTLMLMAVLFVDSVDGFIFHSIHVLDCSLIPMLCYVIIVCACVTHAPVNIDKVRK